MAFFMNRRKQRALDDIQREIDHLRGRIDHIRGRTEAATGQAVATLKAETGQMARALDHGRRGPGLPAAGAHPAPLSDQGWRSMRLSTPCTVISGSEPLQRSWLSAPDRFTTVGPLKTSSRLWSAPLTSSCA